MSKRELRGERDPPHSPWKIVKSFSGQKLSSRVWFYALLVIPENSQAQQISHGLGLLCSKNGAVVRGGTLKCCSTVLLHHHQNIIMCSFIIHQEFEFEMFFLEFGRSRVVRNREITGIATLYFFVIRISSLLLLLQWSLNLLHRGPPILMKNHRANLGNTIWSLLLVSMAII